MNFQSLQNSLKNIFLSITPDELKEVEVFNISMEIFTELLEEMCHVSIDIQEVFKDETFQRDMFKDYNGKLFDVLNSLKTNPQFFEENELFRKQNNKDLLDIDLISNPEKFLSKEEVNVFRQFFEKAGLKEGIEFVYEWLGKKTTKKPLPIDIVELQPFVLDVNGTLQSSLYENVVKVLQYPLGFQYQYQESHKINLNKKTSGEHFWNTDNQWRLTPDIIDNQGSYQDDFWSNHNNNNLKETLTSQDFPEFDLFYSVIPTHKYTSLKMNILSKEAFSSEIYDFFFVHENINGKLVQSTEEVTLVHYEDMSSNDTWKHEFLFSNGYRLEITNTYLGDTYTLRYLNEFDSLIIFMNNIEVDIIEFEIEETPGSSTTLDYLMLGEGAVLHSNFHRTYHQANTGISEELPEEEYWYDQKFPPQRWVDQGLRIDQARNSSLMGMDYGGFDVLELGYGFEVNHDVALMFEFLPDGTDIGPGTPYSNEIRFDYSPQELQDGQLVNYNDYEDWNSSYFDYAYEIRHPILHKDVFQRVGTDDSEDWYFSQLDYEPWQEFQENDERPEYGYWTKEENKWKFIGQQSNRPVNTIGEEGLIINRGVRKYQRIPGFIHEEPNYALLYNEMLIDNQRKYWQPQQGIFTPKLGENYKLNGVTLGGSIHSNGKIKIGYNIGDGQQNEVSSYNEFLYKQAQGQLDGNIYGGQSFISIVDNILTINTDDDENIGIDFLTNVFVTDNEIQVNTPNGMDQIASDNVYLKPTEEGGIFLEAKDTTDVELYWFELPRKRISNKGDVPYTFFRQISPRQEEYNYMYFETKKSPNQDPINLQYRTLEMFQIKTVPQ